METDILFADPDEALRNLYHRYFDRKGLTVETAADECECLRQLSVGHPGLLIIDIDLFDHEGRLREQHNLLFADVPVVIFTGDSLPRQLSEASGLPISCCFRKPYSFLVLLERMHTLSSRVDRVFQHCPLAETGNGGEWAAPAMAASQLN